MDPHKSPPLTTHSPLFHSQLCRKHNLTNTTIYTPVQHLY